MSKFDKLAKKAKKAVQNNENTALSVPSAKQAQTLMQFILQEMGNDSNSFKFTTRKRGNSIIKMWSREDGPEMEYIASDKKVYITFNESDVDPQTKEAINKLIPKNIQKELEKDCSEKSIDQITVPLKLFNAIGAGTWYIYQHIEDDIYMAFCDLGDPMMAELGTVSLKELMQVSTGIFGGYMIERDKFFQPTSLQEIMDKVKNGLVVS